MLLLLFLTLVVQLSQIPKVKSGGVFALLLFHLDMDFDLLEVRGRLTRATHNHADREGPRDDQGNKEDIQRHKDRQTSRTTHRP